jgi:enoyl-CoA hydratase
MSTPALPPGLSITEDGPVRIVTIDNGDLNSISEPIHDGLVDVWAVLERDEAAGAVVLRGSGRHFTAGGDFAWFRELVGDERARERSFNAGQRIIDAMLRFPLPVVAAIQGGAVGLGASLGMLADYVLMTPNAFYRDPHVSIALAAGDGGMLWPFSMGMQVAKQYLLLGERLTAPEALRLGIVNRVVDPDALETEALAVAHRFAALPPQAVRTTKRALNLIIEQTARGAFEYALSAERLGYHTPEFTATMDRLARRDE